MRARRVGWGVAGLVLLALVGCSGPATAPPAPPAEPTVSVPAVPRLPARPAELRLDGVEPCGLLTSAQRARFGLDAGDRGEDTDQFGSPDCVWLRSTLPPYGGPVVRPITKIGAEAYLGNSAPVEVVNIGGFAAVQTDSAAADPDRGCLVLVDVAPGQTLWTQYDKSTGELNGMNHELACAKAREVAEATVSTLRAQLGK